MGDWATFSGVSPNTKYFVHALAGVTFSLHVSKREGVPSGETPFIVKGVSDRGRLLLKPASSDSSQSFRFTLRPRGT